MDFFSTISFFALKIAALTIIVGGTIAVVLAKPKRHKSFQTQIRLMLATLLAVGILGFQNATLIPNANEAHGAKIVPFDTASFLMVVFVVQFLVFLKNGGGRLLSNHLKANNIHLLSAATDEQVPKSS